MSAAGRCRNWRSRAGRQQPARCAAPTAGGTDRDRRDLRRLRGQGELDGALDLQIPLGKGTPRVVVDFASSDAALQIKEPALAFERLSGRFRYDTACGLSADEIQARLFGRAVNGKAVATGSVGKPASRIGRGAAWHSNRCWNG